MNDTAFYVPSEKLARLAEAAERDRGLLLLEPPVDRARELVGARELLGLAEAMVRGAQVVERALQVSPSDAKAYHLMGRVLDRLSLPEQAQEMYHRCRDLAGL